MSRKYKLQCPITETDYLKTKETSSSTHINDKYDFTNFIIATDFLFIVIIIIIIEKLPLCRISFIRFAHDKKCVLFQSLHILKSRYNILIFKITFYPRFHLEKLVIKFK